MRLFQRKKNNSPAITLDDCVKRYKENPQYRYVVVAGKDRLPRSLCETIESAKDDLNVHLISGGQLPAEIVDLAFYEMEGTYATKRPWLNTTFLQNRKRRISDNKK